MGEDNVAALLRDKFRAVVELDGVSCTDWHDTHCWLSLRVLAGGWVKELFSESDEDKSGPCCAHVRSHLGKLQQNLTLFKVPFRHYTTLSHRPIDAPRCGRFYNFSIGTFESVCLCVCARALGVLARVEVRGTCKSFAKWFLATGHAK
eukprot:1050621-Amphidinium_carterae.1